MTSHRPPFVSLRLAGSIFAVGLALVAAFALPGAGSTNLIHTEASSFSPIVVFEQGDERCMNFDSVHAPGRQSCIDLQAPDKLVFDYTRTMMTALFVKPDPSSVLIVGLGGGTLSRALGKALPEAVIDTVEIDPAVAKVAQRFFGYKQGPRQRLFLEDGRAFIERVHREGRHYDVVMLDAFDVDYIPAHLLTREFLQHVRAILTPNGVLVANTFSRSAVYAQESATYADVFGDFFNLRDGNRVIIATRGTLPDTATLQDNAHAVASKLKPFGINIKNQLHMFSTVRDWDENAPVLTD
ncbi:MAG TPA: fused MFS/spermidine synthase [Eoetvoesiella sp.]